MFLINNIYHHLPIFLQNFAMTCYGYWLKKQRYGGNFQQYLSEIEKNQWLSVKDLQEIQERKLQNIIAHSYKNIPYYKNLFDSLCISPQDIKTSSDLKKIPILEKQTIKNNKNNFIAQNISKRELIPYSTGGTTGAPLILYITKNSLQYNFACGEARVKHWAGVKTGDKLATFLGRVVVAPSVIKPPFWRYNKANNQILFSSFHLNEKNSDFYIDELNCFQPKIVQGYVSIIHQFAKYILKLHKKICPPKAVLVSSETLFDWQKEDIEKAFGARVFNSYSLAEFVAFVSQCERGGLHISPEYGIIELEPAGGINFEIIATTLFNYAMPLIRYKTGDLVTLDENKSCACGRALPLIKSIEGRSDSMLITPEGHSLSPASLSLVFAACPNIHDSQIIQTANDSITLKIVKEKQFNEKDLKNLVDQLKKRLGKVMKIDIEFVQEIARTDAGKRRLIISKIKPL